MTVILILTNEYVNPLFDIDTDSVHSTNSEQHNNITKDLLPKILIYELGNIVQSAQFNRRLMADILGTVFYAAHDELYNRLGKVKTLFDAIGNSEMTKDDTHYDIALLHYLEQ